MAVEALSEEETLKVIEEMQRQLGLLDNPALQSYLSQPGGPQRQHKGKPIISYKQYLEFSEKDVRLDDFWITVATPKGITQKVQASKLHKYMNDPDYPCLPIELFNERKEKEEKARERVQDIISKVRGGSAREAGTDKTLTVYWCNYEGCGRFFDREHAAEVHYNLDHKLGIARRPKGKRGKNGKGNAEGQEVGQGDALGAS